MRPTCCGAACVQQRSHSFTRRGALFYVVQHCVIPSHSLNNCSSFINDAAVQLRDYLLKQSSATSSVDVWRPFGALTLDITGRISLGCELGALDHVTATGGDAPYLVSAAEDVFGAIEHMQLKRHQHEKGAWLSHCLTRRDHCRGLRHAHPAAWAAGLLGGAVELAGCPCL